MLDTESLKANGVEIKLDKDKNLILGITSQNISNEQLRILSMIEEDCLLAFYSCNFSKCDLSILEKSKFKRIAIVYCTLENEDFIKLCESPNLTWLKLFDTKVTNEIVEKVRESNSDLQIILN